MFRKILVLMVVLALFITLIACGEKQKQEIDKGVAIIVNGEKIMKSEYDKTWEQVSAQYIQQGIDLESEDGKQMAEVIKQNIIDSMISEKLIEQEVNKRDYEISDEEINEQLKIVKSGFTDEEEYNKALETHGIMEAELIEDINRFLATNMYFDEVIGEITATEEEVQELYDKYKEQDPEIPELDEIKAQVEQEVIQKKKQQEQFVIIEGLKNESDIEILI